MKIILLLIVTIVIFSNNSNAQITDLALSADPTSVCLGSSSTISTTGSQTGVTYVLRNSSNSIVDGPIAGTGNDISFSTGALSSLDTFNVYATQTIGDNLTFDGVDDYVNLSTHDRGVTTVTSIGCWVKTSVSGVSQYVISKYAGGYGVLLIIDANGKAKFDGKGAGGSYMSSGPSLTTVNDGQWHYIVGTTNNQFSSKTWKIYVDGVLESSSSSSWGTDITTNTPLFVGVYNGNYFTGEIDDVQIWRIELSLSAIQSYMTSCLTGSETSLRGWFKFDEGSGFNSTDLSTIGAHGLLVNMDSTSSWVSNSASPCYSSSTSAQMTQTVPINTISINDETVTGSSSICNGDSITITTGSSVSSINYFLLDGNGNTITGPIVGTGSSLIFNTGPISSTTTYSVIGEGPSVPLNNSLSFDGVNDHVNLSNSNRGVSTEISVSCWVKTSSTGTSQFIYYKYDGTAGSHLILDASGKALFAGRDGSGTYRSSGASSTVVNDGQWHYLTGTAKIGNGFRIYVDGVLESSGNFGGGTGYSNSVNAYIGSSGSTTNVFNGEIDDLGIWNSFLDVTTIQTNMSNCLTGSETNLVGWFNFNANNTSVLTDYSSVDIDGTLVNMLPSASWLPSTATNCVTSIADCSLTMTQTATATITSIDTTTSLTGNVITANQTTATYRWLNCDSTYSVFPGETNASFTPTFSGNFAVEITLNGCVDTSACVNVTLSGINEINALFKNVSIFPNPVDKMVNIDLGSLSDASIAVYTLSGQIVHQENNIYEKNYQFELNAPTGVYFVEISSEGQRQQYKLVKL